MKKIKRRRYKVKRKKSIFKNRLFGEGFLFFLEVSLIFYFLIFSQTFQVDKVYIFGNKEVKSQNLQNFLQGKIEKFSPFTSIANIFLVNSRELEREILKKFPKINIVEIKKKFPNMLDIMVEEKKAVAIFCLEEQFLSSETISQCGFLDKKGIVFEENCSLNEDLPLIKSLESEKKINLGGIVIEKEILEEILKINENLENELKLSLEEYILATGSRLNVKTSQGWEIFFDLKTDIDLQILKLRLLLEEEILPENRKIFEYIDLRLPRVYYK